ncbi:MAG: NADH:flavin oxidoreductase [Clostridia bacterium]|nr:NADH:flavin oxidoreductase [Clostridia bacterium]
MKTIFDKSALGNLNLKNRLIRSATWEALADQNGNMQDTLFSTYEKLAKGGVGAIISGFTSVADNDHYFGGMARLANDALIEAHKRLTDSVHKYACPIIAQLALGEYNGAYRNMDVDDMTAEDIDSVKNVFVAAADRAVMAGYDGIQLHAAHGFFLSRFISPAYNRRTDAYGGSPANRATLVLESLREVKRRHPDLHVSMKINCNDFMSGGLTEQESLRICKLCAGNGMDSIEVSGNGTSVSGIRAGKNEAYFQDFALRLAAELSIPVILVGGHRSIENMNRVLNAGNIEFLSLSRPLIREPDLPNRWQSGDTSPATCVSCNMCYRTPGHACVFCAQNR